MDRVEALEKEIRQHNQHYWIDNKPVISDIAYDQLVEELKSLDPYNVVLQEVGVGDSRGKISHLRPMLSLDKCYSIEDLVTWAAKVGGKVIVTPKIDGLAVSLRYNHKGELTTATTRGDGRKGDNIIDNIIRVTNVPVHLKMAASVEVRGEVYMPIWKFEELIEKKPGSLANPRNAAAGALKRKNPIETAKAGLCFIAYDLLGIEVDTEWDKFNKLSDLGFETPPFKPLLTTQNELELGIDYFRNLSKKLEYETDGIVFKANSVDTQKELGATAHHPRYAIAWKFSGENQTSVLREVLWQVSRTGSLNPVAIIDDVEVDGATINRVSLHNLAIMDKLGIKLESQVEVTRRGGVIPHIESAKGGDQEIELPDKCPGCGGNTYEEGDFIYAFHRPTCIPWATAEFVYFSDKLGLKGIGDKQISTLLERELLRPGMLTDLFMIPEERLAEVMGQKNAAKLNTMRKSLISRIEEADVLTALGIFNVGRTIADKVLKAVGGLRVLLNVSKEALLEIEGVGPEIAESLSEGLRRRKSDILFLYSVLKPVGPATGGKFAGEVFLFTGKLERYSREEAEGIIKQFGGEVANSLTKRVTCVVTSDELAKDPSLGTSSKIKKAVVAGTTIIGETEFVSRCVND